MKFSLLTALLASCASYALGTTNPVPNGTPAALLGGWSMDFTEASIAYDTGTNTFTLDAGVNTNFASDQMQATFYSAGCKADGVAKAGLFTDVTQSVSSNVLRTSFKADPQSVNNDSNLSIDTGDPNKNQVDFCVRVSTGYTVPGNPATFKEVNFAEAVITVIYLLDGTFKVEDINVKPKDRVSKTETESKYELEAFLCGIGSYDDITDQNTQDNPFKQGSLISVCVKPKTTDAGVVMNGIQSFDWSGPADQNAITGGQPSNNKLTSYDPSACISQPVCRFSSILFADFYLREATVTGNGAARVMFANRRLGDEDRALQEADAESEFGLTIDVGIAEDGPGAIKTAGGVSVGLTALASIMALAGSVIFF